ncbi:cysteine-rich receptor-like protein kinase 5 [Gossypium australe]|uniref:Cysteine-rich receptor-like protein kinase 5 n=1 Tax=Gossypium australe TaxID=47621 RepID=A0A5B6WI08_9ROSI|nr:cysteine-rich receptor-like protein kinase 5 [Gossypium australe]
MLNSKPTTTPVVVGVKLSSQEDHEEVCESTYRSLIDCLLYFTATRPDIMFTVSLLSRFMHCCNIQHFQAAKRSIVAQSTTEAEYVAAASAVNQAIWIYCDNKSAVEIVKNRVFHGRTKHFNIKLHVVREMEQACEIKHKLRKLMGVCSMEAKEE